MSKKSKIILVSLLIFTSLVLTSCKRQEPTETTWIQDAQLDDFLDLKIEKITVCTPTPDDDDIEKWTVIFEISDPEKIKKLVEALEKAERIERACWPGKMKIITSKGKYTMNFDFDDEVVCGDHFESKEAWELLNQWGFFDVRKLPSPPGFDKQ